MEQSAKDAVVKDAQINLRKVDCASGMGHVLNAAAKDAQTFPEEE